MNQSKFSLADVLTLLTALTFGFVCYLGANFYTLGNTSQSIILAAVITVLLCGTMLGAKLLKRTGRNFKTCFVWEIILLVLSGLTTFFAYSPFLHYFSVSEQKMEIRSKLTASITQAENMFTEYERYAKNRENLYESKLRSVAAAKNTRPKEFDEYGFINNIPINKQIENKMFTIHAHLFPSNYEEMEQTGSAWLVNARNIVNSWNWTGIIGIVNEVEKNSNDWLNTLVELSAVREKGEQTEDFAYDLSFDDVKNHFTTLGKPTLLSIGLAIVVYLLMLLSYLISERSTKTTIGTTNSKGGEFYIDY